MPFSVDGNLVRGFDYYTGIVWEVTAGGLGAQNAIGGGGRYDNLVETLGGKPTPGVGFGSGIERLLLALESQQISLPVNASPLVWLVAHGDAARDANWQLMQTLRAAGIRADMDPSGRSVKSQFKLADREKAAFCIVVGDSELAASTVMLKNLQSGEQTAVPRDQIVEKASDALMWHQKPQLEYEETTPWHRQRRTRLDCHCDPVAAAVTADGQNRRAGLQRLHVNEMYAACLNYTAPPLAYTEDPAQQATLVNGRIIPAPLGKKPVFLQPTEWLNAPA